MTNYESSAAEGFDEKVKNDHLKSIAIKPFECKELTKNDLLKESLSKTAQDLGYIVTANKSITGEPSGFQPSRYSWSRPDITIYHPNQKCAYVVMIVMIMK